MNTIEKIITDQRALEKRIEILETLLNFNTADESSGVGIISDKSEFVPIIPEGSYGIRWKIGQPDSIERVGDAKLLETKPAHRFTKIVVDKQHMVKVMPFYFHAFIYNNEYQYLLVSDKKMPNFLLHPWYIYDAKTLYSYQLIGCHQACIIRDKLSSLPNINPTTSKTRKQFREAASKQGDAWYQYSFNAMFALQVLYLTEKAEFDLTKDAEQNNYHEIEYLFTGTWTFVDGITIHDGQMFITNDNTAFADDTEIGEKIGHILPHDDPYWIKDVIIIKEGIFPITLCSSKQESVIKSRYYINPGWRVLLSSGALNYGAFGGVAYFYAFSASSFASSYFGSRLCKNGLTIIIDRNVQDETR